MILTGRWIFQMLLSAFIIYSFILLFRIIDTLSELKDKDCTDEFTETLFLSITKKIKDSIIYVN